MSRGRTRSQRPESGAVRNHTRDASPVRPKGAWQAGNQAISRVLSQMQQSTAEDLSNIEVDQSPRARETTGQLGANAVTSGDTVMLGAAAPSLETEPGQRLLAHELTHVVQQRRAATVAEHAVGPATDSFERAADIGSRVAPQGHSVDVPTGGHAPGVQRQTPPGHSDLDGLDEKLRQIREALQKAAPLPKPQIAPQPAPKQLGPRKATQSVPLAGKKIPPAPKQSKVGQWLGSGHDTEGKGAAMPEMGGGPTAAQAAAGVVDHNVSKTSPPAAPLDELLNRTVLKEKPAPKSSDDETKTPDAAPDAATAKLRSAISGKLIEAMGRAQSTHTTMARLDLDKSFEPQRDAVIAQLDGLFDEARDKLPMVTEVMVSIGGKFIKTLRVPEKK